MEIQIAYQISVTTFSFGVVNKHEKRHLLILNFEMFTD